MKKVIATTFILLIICLPAFAQKIQNNTENQGEFIQQQTLQMTQHGVPQEPATKMLQAMVQNNFQEQNIQQAAKTVMHAAQEGLPTEQIMSKAMEGMAKKADEEDVLAAMNTVRERHSYVNKAKSSLSINTMNKELARAIADSLAAGMKTEDMDDIVGQLRTRARQQTRNNGEELCLQTMQTVRTMAQLGAQSQAIATAMQNALQNNFTATEMKQMRRRVFSQANAEPPVQAAHQFAGEIGKGLNKNEDAAGVGTANQNGHGGGDGGSGNGSGGEAGGGSGNGSGSDSGSDSGSGSGSGSGGGSGGGSDAGPGGGSDSGSSGGSGNGADSGSGGSSGGSGNGGDSGSGGSGGSGSDGGGGKGSK